MSPDYMLKSASREVLPQRGDVSWQRLDRRLEQGIPFNWHHHSEMELTLTLNCVGQRFVGDHVSGFVDGDLALVGSNLPHTWASQDRIDLSQPFLAKVIWFDAEWLKAIGRSAPEFSALTSFCDRAQRGLQFSQATQSQARPLVERLFDLPVREGITTLLELLLLLSRDDGATTLSSIGFLQKSEGYSDRMNRVLDHVHQHYDQPITVEALAAIAALSPSGLHRMFIRHVGVSLSSYLINLRIGEACARLAATNLPVRIISQDVGYSSQANFNRHFLRTRSETPSAYRNRIRGSDRRRH
ncbi:helix-turn-helix transcriptional regulator [Marivivens donghaensis]|uniref:Helix-turn-helix transcriptional regulator n=2 Tax=Marivivens donghaensis TaxID=1699413 RepID=A0ABX0W179_9RHOB|nr:helix-turn-helix transcriptional regulator [Marivivens donghaensis]